MVVVSCSYGRRTSQRRTNPREGIETKQVASASDNLPFVREERILVRGLKRSALVVYGFRIVYCVREERILVRGLKPDWYYEFSDWFRLRQRRTNPREGIETTLNRSENLRIQIPSEKNESS